MKCHYTPILATMYRLISQCLPIVAIKKRDFSFEKIVATLKSVIAHVDLKIGKK